MTSKEKDQTSVTKLELKTVTIKCGSLCVRSPAKCERCGMAKSLSKV